MTKSSAFNPNDAARYARCVYNHRASKFPPPHDSCVFIGNPTTPTLSVEGDLTAVEYWVMLAAMRGENMHLNVWAVVEGKPASCYNLIAVPDRDLDGPEPYDTGRLVIERDTIDGCPMTIVYRVFDIINHTPEVLR